MFDFRHGLLNPHDFNVVSDDPTRQRSILYLNTELFVGENEIRPRVLRPYRPSSNEPLVASVDDIVPNPASNFDKIVSN